MVLKMFCNQSRLTTCGVFRPNTIQTKVNTVNVYCTDKFNIPLNTVESSHRYNSSLAINLNTFLNLRNVKLQLNAVLIKETYRKKLSGIQCSLIADFQECIHDFILEKCRYDTVFTYSDKTKKYWNCTTFTKECEQLFADLKTDSHHLALQ